MKSYVFRVELEEEEDGRWSAVVPALPGCATWGYTAEEALEALEEAAQLYVDVLIEDGAPVPLDDQVSQSVIEGPAVLVTVDSSSHTLAAHPR
jgi:predicted RNase H-like HicB family nuclease